MAEQLLTLTKLSKYYTGKQAVVVGLSGVSLSFSRGEFVAITGESGSGKSTLSHVIGGILPYEGGELLFNGNPTSHFDSLDWERYRRDNISFISQNYGILPGATVMGNVVSALLLTGMEKEAARAAAEQILRQVELWELRNRRAVKLSSGQKQRLSIARALAKPAPILIADEPTGNLDAENSAKVISLLAQAAQDRLVILVTHEFDEAKDLATRHIVLQDGKVASDTALRPAAAPGPMPSVPKGNKRPLSPYVARLQYTSRPVWTGLMAVFFALTAFAVFAFLGVFIISLDDTSTRIYDNSAFRNGATTRIIALSVGRPMTQEDYDAILTIDHVEALEPWGYAADAQYAWQDGVDYRTFYTEHTEDTPEGTVHYVSASYQVLDSAPFAQTIPLLPAGRTFLTAGRLPENFYEVVAASSADHIGSTVTVFLTDMKNWNIGDKVPVEMTVVGVTDHGSGLYFHRDVGRFFRQGMEMLGPSTDTNRYLYLPAANLEDGTFRANSTLFSFLQRDDNTLVGYPFSSRDPWPGSADEPRILQLVGYHDTLPRRLVEVSYADFDALTWKSGPDQVSLTITHYAYTDRVIAALEKLGYAAVSPYRLGSTKQNPELATQREQTLSVCLLTLAAVVALQIVLLRAMFSMQTESYRLLNNIGLTGRTAKLSILWQMLLFTILGQLLGGLGIWLCGQAGIERIVELLHYLPPAYVLLLSGVHLAASMLSTVWIIRALGRQVYPLAGKYVDLALDAMQEGGAV